MRFRCRNHRTQACARCLTEIKLLEIHIIPMLFLAFQMHFLYELGVGKGAEFNFACFLQAIWTSICQGEAVAIPDYSTIPFL